MGRPSDTASNELSTHQSRSSLEKSHNTLSKSSSRRKKSKSKHQDDDNDDRSMVVESESSHEDKASRKESRKRKHRMIGSREDQRSDDRDSNARSHRKRHHRSKKHQEEDAHRDKKKNKKGSEPKSSSRHDKEGKAEKTVQTRLPDKSTFVPLGPRRGCAPNELLIADDYFSYHKHFWIYLWREEGISFNELTSEASHTAFGRFVSRYNSGDLESAFYDPSGLPLAAINECKTTLHKWNFSTTLTEVNNLQQVQVRVRQQTDYRDAAMDHAQPGLHLPRPRRDVCVETQNSSKRVKDYVKSALYEDLNEGRSKDEWERRIEKKREIGERTHAASRDRDAAAGFDELTDEAMYSGAQDNTGGGSDNFLAALAREKNRKANRQEQQIRRAQELQLKEKAKHAEMLQKLGLTNVQLGQKITITPRNDDNPTGSS